MSNRMLKCIRLSFKILFKLFSTLKVFVYILPASSRIRCFLYLSITVFLSVCSVKVQYSFIKSELQIGFLCGKIKEQFIATPRCLITDNSRLRARLPIIFLIACRFPLINLLFLNSIIWLHSHAVIRRVLNFASNM